MEGNGETVFRTPASWASKALSRSGRSPPYRSGRSPDWLKMKNADAPAVKREAEEDWGAMSVAPESGRNRIMIYGPRNDGTYIGRVHRAVSPNQNRQVALRQRLAA
jgi:hypothetical protein